MSCEAEDFRSDGFVRVYIPQIFIIVTLKAMISSKKTVFPIKGNRFPGVEYLRLMRFHKPVGTFLLLWPTLSALWIAGNGRPSPELLIIFIAGVVIMRAAGCVINDIFDRKFDRHVARTCNRPLANKKILLSRAWILFFCLILIAAGLALLLNKLTLSLAVLALCLAMLYPLAKRYTYWPQLILALPWSMGIPMAFAAQTDQVPWIAWLLFIMNSMWVMAYDTQYAMADRPEDIQIGIKSTAILFGQRDREIIALFQVVAWLLLLIIGISLHLSIWFYAALGVVALLFVYQQHLIRQREPAQCLQAFLQNQWVGAVIFLGFYSGFLR